MVNLSIELGELNNIMFNEGKLLIVGPDIKSGPEFKPLREFNVNCPVIVFVLDLKDDSTVIAQGEMNYADSEHRRWLGKLSFWAYSNGYSVETAAKKDIEL